MKLGRFPVHPGAVYGVVKELRAAAEDYRPIVLAGWAGSAGELRDALIADGDAQAVRDLSGSELSAYDVEGAGVLLYVVEGENTTPADEETLKRVASMTDGEYYSAESANELLDVFRKLPTSLITKHDVMEISVVFVALGAVLAVLAMFLAQVWRPLP